MQYPRDLDNSLVQSFLEGCLTASYQEGDNIVVVYPRNDDR